MQYSLSVVMPVHNALPFLDEAIESILGQSFADFEFVIGDDCSTDGSAERIDAYAGRDPRIRALRANGRLGPLLSSRWVADAAQAPLVARMDADDIAHPERLRSQVDALNAHPSAVLVATLMEAIDRHGRRIRREDRSILVGREWPILPHPSLMYRRRTYVEIGGYRDGTAYFEDFDLTERLRRHGDVLYIAAPLVSYRLAGTSARLRDDPAHVEEQLNLRDSARGALSPPVNPRRPIRPRTFRALGSLRLWSYQPADILSDMIARMELHPPGMALRTFAWAAVVSFAPRLARAGSRLLVSLRNWRVRRLVRPGHLYQWVPKRAPIELGPVDALK